MEQPGGSNQPAAQEQEPTVEKDISRDPTPPPQVEDERPVLLGEEQSIQEEAVVARENDSFDATVAIVPRSQQLARNSIRPTFYDDVAHIVTTPVHKFHDFVYKYINVIGQVVSVFRTTKGSVIIRIWDGTAHKFVHNTHLFFAEDAWIEYYYSQPMKQFQDLPKEYFVDIVVYGEFIYIAENLRSGDMIHLVNVHMYRPKTQRQITPSVHENGQAYHRQIVLLDEEEQIIVDKKSLLVEKLEYVKANSNGGNVSRMAGFFNRPSAQVRPLLQQSPRASTMPGTSASTGRMLSEFHTARHILTEREVSESKDVATVGGQKRSVVDDDVGLIEQPLKKSPKLMPTTQKRPPAPADVAPAVPSTSLSNCLAPPHKDGRAAESSTLVPTVQQHEKIPDPLSQCSKDALESYLEAFFRNKINLRTENVDYMLPSTSGMRAEQSIYNFLNRKPVLINCSVQTSPQPSPVKKSNKAVQTNIEPFRPATRDSSAQKTPVKMRNADCVTDPAETRVAQTSPFRAPTTNVVSSPITSPYQSVYRRIKKEATVSPLLKSPPAPRPPSRADSLTRDMVSRRGTKRTAVAPEDSRPPVPPHKKKSKTESPRKSIENKPEVDSIVLKPRCYTKPQQNIFAKPKYPAKRAGEEEKPPIQSSPAQNLRIRPARDSSISSISSRTRSAKMKPSGSEEEPEQKPVRIVVINRSFLETEVQPSWSQQVNVATRRRSTRGKSYKTSEVRPIKFER